VIEERRIGDLKLAAHAAETQIASREDQRFHACRHHCPGTHRAGFKGAIHGCVFEAVIAYRKRSLTERQHLRMRGGIEQFNRRVAPLPNRFRRTHDEAPHRHLTRRRRFACQIESTPHPALVGFIQISHLSLE